MQVKISPAFKMDLLDKIEKELWLKYLGYRRVTMYIAQWQVDLGFGETNFQIFTQGKQGQIDLSQTLSHIDDEIILKMSIDLGIETPDFIPAVAEIENVFKVNYQTAQQTFQKALNQCYENPENAVALANSALESIIKHILKNEHFGGFDRNKTLYALTIDLLKQFNLFPPKDMPVEIKNIGSSLLKITQNIENLRSNNTNSHGKLSDDYVVTDPVYSFFVVNSVTTVGLFMISFYEKKFQPAYLEKNQSKENEDLEEVLDALF
jgi:hypothetical protein